MKRTALVLLSLCAVVASASVAEAVNHNNLGRAPRRGQHVQRAPRAPSVVLPRLQRTASGNLPARNVSRIPDSDGRVANLRRQAGRYPQDAYKRAAGEWPKVNPNAGRAGGRVADLRRQGGRFANDAWKRGAGEWSKVDPRAGRTSGRVADLRRHGGRYPQDAWKRGAGEWPKVDPKTGRTGGSRLASKQARPPRGTKPGVGRGGKMIKGAGAIGLAVGAGTAGASAIANIQRLDADLRAGRITQAQYNRAQATNALEVGGTVVAIKKMTPTAMAGNLLVGTDPISLGVDAVGDLINGTNNAERSIQNVGKALEGHGRGLAKLATDPVGWANEAGRNIDTEMRKVEKDLNNAAKDVGKALDQAGKDVDKFFKGIFGG